MLVAPQQPPTAPLLALVRSRLDDGRSPWAAEGLVSVGVGSGLAVLIVQASPRPPEFGDTHAAGARRVVRCLSRPPHRW